MSYIKFVDSSTFVSSSTDNTLKLWDLSMCGSRVIDTPLQSFTGHLNVKVRLNWIKRTNLCLVVCCFSILYLPSVEGRIRESCS